MDHLKIPLVFLSSWKRLNQERNTSELFQNIKGSSFLNMFYSVTVKHCFKVLTFQSSGVFETAEHIWKYLTFRKLFRVHKKKKNHETGDFCEASTILFWKKTFSWFGGNPHCNVSGWSQTSFWKVLNSAQPLLSNHLISTERSESS